MFYSSYLLTKTHGLLGSFLEVFTFQYIDCSCIKYFLEEGIYLKTCNCFFYGINMLQLNVFTHMFKENVPYFLLAV